MRIEKESGQQVNKLRGPKINFGTQTIFTSFCGTKTSQKPIVLKLLTVHDILNLQAVSEEKSINLRFFVISAKKFEGFFGNLIVDFVRHTLLKPYQKLPFNTS